MPVKTMDSEARDRLVGALGRVADLVDDGMPPNAAIAKAAAVDGLPRGHIPLAVHAYNIGRTNRQRTDGATLEEKAAAFELATIPGVYDQMFPETIQTKAASERASGIADVYMRPPTPRAKPIAPVVKAAQAETPKKVVLDIATAVSRRAKRAKVVEEARRMATVARETVNAELEKLASEFERPGAPAIADVRRNVELRDGDTGLALLDHVAAIRPALAKKKASAKFDYHPVTDYPGIYQRITRSVESACGALEVAGWHAEMAKEATALDRYELAPFGPTPPKPDTILGELAAEEEATKTAGIYDHAFDAVKTIHANDTDSVVESALSKISTPEHEQQLRAIQARSMLHSMLHDDEVLRGHNPYEVAHHFNRLSQFAPHLAERPLAAIPAVRKSVQQGQLDTFDAKELADTESKLRPAQKDKDHGK